MEHNDNPTEAPTMRDRIATLIAPLLRLSGFRFSKDYRHATHGPKAWIYRHVNTVQANHAAGL